jgi:simple sugar transport system substrate-binding protein
MRRGLKLSVFVSVVFLILSLTAFAGSKEELKPGPAKGAEELQKGKKLKFALVSVCTTVDFWRPVDKGMKDAAEWLNVEAEHVGPQGFDVAATADAAENLLVAGVDGIALFIPMPGSMDKIIEKYKAAGIPIMVLNTGLADAEKHGLGFDGHDNYAIGRAWGEKILKSISPNPAGKKVCILIESPGQTSLELRRKGAEEILIPKGVKVDKLDTTTDRMKAYSAVENYYLANPDCSGFFSTDTTGSPVAGEFVRKNNLKGKVVVGGFDLTPEVVDGIIDGYITFTVDQYPYEQGFLCVLQLFFANTLGLRPFIHKQVPAFVTIEDAAKVKELSALGYR